MSAPFVIVFDLDGTLVDSAPDLHVAANRMLAEMVRPPLSLPQVTGFVGNGVPKLVERCLAATGGGGDFDVALAAFRRHYDAAPADLTRPFPGAVAACESLVVGGFRLGICTNKPEAPARRILTLLGMSHLFGCVVGGDTLAAHKPDPETLRHAIAALGGERAGSLYVGDSETDAETAANAGVAFALYAGGYRKSPLSAFGGARLIFDDFADLARHVLEGPSGGQRLVSTASTASGS